MTMTMNMNMNMNIIISISISITIAITITLQARVFQRGWLQAVHMGQDQGVYSEKGCSLLSGKATNQGSILYSILCP
jgi:hypothetical protein